MWKGLLIYSSWVSIIRMGLLILTWSPLLMNLINYSVVAGLSAFVKDVRENK